MVKTPGIAPGNNRFVPKTSTVSTSSLMTLLVLGLPAFAIGCGAGGTDLEDTARNISRRSTQTLEHAGMAGAGADDDEAGEDGEDGEETDVSAATDDGAAGAGPDDDMGGDEEPGTEGDDAAASGPAAGAGGGESDAMAAEGPTSDDSVRCGNGVVDLGELCDILIEDGEEGACPKAADCPQLDACHAPKLLVHGCQSECVQGEPIDC